METSLNPQTLCVIGLGYIGLPTASTFATHGMQVMGVDTDASVLALLRQGEVHIHEPGLRALVRDAFESGNLTVMEEPGEADAFMIAVPTPIQEDHSADLSHVKSAAEAIVPVLRPGNLVMLESTCPPRTTLDLLKPILEQSGLTAGSDFHLAYSPERVLPGKILQELVENTRVIGGIDPASAEAGRKLYKTFVQGQIILTDASTAEMVKLMENTYRDVGIALANEFSDLAERFGVDVWEAIKLANFHPRVQILQPGPGVGGHCISVDPWFLVEAAPDMTELIRSARMVNDRRPEQVVSRMVAFLGGLSGRRIAALGLSYKADVDDLRESPAVEIVRRLVAEGAEVVFFEPNVPQAEVQGAKAADTLETALKGAQAAILLVDHHPFRELDPALVAEWMEGDLVFDTRGVWVQDTWQESGLDLHHLGVG